MRLFTAVLAVVSTSSFGAAGLAAPPDPSPRPVVVPWSNSVELDGAESVLSHAAGLGFLPGFELAAVMTSRLQGDAAVAGAAVMLGARLGPLALALGVGGVGDGPGSDTTTTRVDFGVALRLGDSLSIGYQNTSLYNEDVPAIDRYDGSSISLTWRPTRGFGLALAVDHFDDPLPVAAGVEENPIVRAGFAFRPFTQRVTLGLEGARELAGDAYWRVTGSARAMVVPGLALGVYGRFGFAEAGPAPATTEIGAMLGIYQGGLGIETGFDFAQTDGSTTDQSRLSVLVRGRAERLPSIRPDTHQVVRLALRGELAERPDETLFGDPQPGFAHYLEALEMMRRDDHVDGLVIQIDVAPSWVQCWELRASIARLRAAKKKVVVVLTVADMRAMYLAAAADDVELYAGGGLMLTGLAITQTYYLGLMQRLGVNAEFVKWEDYKSAPEAFTRTGPSEPSKEQTRALLDGVDAAWIDAVKSGRKKDEAELRAMLESGPQSMNDATRLGLVDGLVEADALGEVVQRVFGKEARVVEHYRPPMESFAAWAKAPTIAIIAVTGSIVDGGSSGPLPLPIPFIGSETTGDETFIRSLEAASDDGSVVGIIVRVDSGGGSATASDRMNRAVINAAKKKPLIVSFGDVAASGGYYLAAGAPTILASPLTITGSIGIFSGKVDLSGFYALLGITHNVEKTNSRADMMDPYRPFTDAEREQAQNALKAYYDRFVKVVSDGRKLPLADTYAIARGRVWLGTSTSACSARSLSIESAHARGSR